MPFVKKVSLQKNIFGYGFALKSERPCIVDVVMPNSVAAAANVSCGDSLLTVNGVDVSHLPHADVASLIWSAGSTITIEFLSYDETSLTICDASRPPQRDSVFEDIFLSHSPLFGAQTAASIHKRSAVVMFIGKVPIDVTHSADVPHILQRIPYLVDKAESLIQGPNTSNASCLLEIFTDSLRIRLLHRAFQYPTNGILFTDVVKDDTRFFFLVTRGHNRHLDVRINFQTRSLRSNRSRDGSSGPSMASCCLFRCLPPKLLGHRSHATLVKQFDLACHRDRLTGECAEFPRDATSVVSTLRELDDVWLRHIEQPTDHLLASSPVDNHEQMRALDLSTVGSQFSTPVAAFRKSTTSSVFKRPGSVLRPSTSRIFGKLTKAAGYIRDRWNDRRNSSVHSSTDRPHSFRATDFCSLP
ncbi:hypothetical protein D915_010956 [Fasciola hepatica]|uniref:PDZ domain-containing protein n=1 Tax=Fasciola hepatica TaxID=6192 RepID=A0A4E0QYY4_FASHE|nr:hypothetical protein D915_010956 [Fasciola hepatica]